jgi:hypothetical protein
MHYLASYLVGGALAALAIDGVSGDFEALRWAGLSDLLPATSAPVVNRDLKGNRLPIAVTNVAPTARTVRLAGQIDNFVGPVDFTRTVMFNPVPMTAAGSSGQNFGTWNVGLNTATPSRPILRPDVPVRPIPTRTAPPRLPDACDPAFSPIAAPTLAHIIGRCLT